MSAGMMRDDRQVALNDLLVACQQAAEGYADAAERVEEADLARLLAELGARRRDSAERLQAGIRRLGDLPQSPDPEAALLRQTISRVRAALSADQRRSLLAERRQADQTLLALARTALSFELPPELRTSVESCRDRLAADLERLSARRP